MNAYTLPLSRFLSMWGFADSQRTNQNQVHLSSLNHYAKSQSDCHSDFLSPPQHMQTVYRQTYVKRVQQSKPIQDDWLDQMLTICIRHEATNSSTNHPIFLPHLGDQIGINTGHPQPGRARLHNWNGTLQAARLTITHSTGRKQDVTPVPHLLLFVEGLDSEILENSSCNQAIPLFGTVGQS